MDIIIAGGLGFVGQYVSDHLTQQGHVVKILTRNQAAAASRTDVLYWDGHTWPKAASNLPLDVVINLCGMNISAKRWRPSVKKALLESRIQPTKAIVDHLKSCPEDQQPMLINASAIGYYPSHDAVQSEDEAAQPAPDYFSHQLVFAWEAEALKAQAFHAKVACLRFGVVLGQGGGILQKLWPAYRLGLGAILGDANAYMSWIHIADLARAIDFLMSRESIQPIYNLTAPSPCTQRQFANAMAQMAHKPSRIQLPSALVRLMFGEMGQELLLANQKIAPKRLQSEGFQFEYPKIDGAIAQLLSPKEGAS